MRVRCEAALLICLVLSAGIKAQAQKLTDNHAPVKKPDALRVPKMAWLALSAVTYTAAALDMHATASAVDYWKKYPAFYLGYPEADPIAKPFVKLPRPAYYSSGFAFATGVNWLGYKMSRSRKWRKVWWLPQSISISANGNGYRSSFR